MQAEATLFKTLADPTRLRLAVLLALNGETCVCELAAALDAPDFRVSRHLAIMTDRGAVEARREGTWMHYRLVVPRGKLEECLQDCFRDCLAAHPDVIEDRQRLRAYQARQMKSCDGNRSGAALPGSGDQA
jgi:ArsR family transcriptional regulator